MLRLRSKCPAAFPALPAAPPLHPFPCRSHRCPPPRLTEETVSLPWAWMQLMQQTSLGCGCGSGPLRPLLLRRPCRSGCLLASEESRLAGPPVRLLQQALLESVLPPRLAQVRRWRLYWSLHVPLLPTPPLEPLEPRLPLRLWQTLAMWLPPRHQRFNSQYQLYLHPHLCQCRNVALTLRASRNRMLALMRSHSTSRRPTRRPLQQLTSCSLEAPALALALVLALVWAWAADLLPSLRLQAHPEATETLTEMHPPS